MRTTRRAWWLTVAGALLLGPTAGGIPSAAAANSGDLKHIVNQGAWAADLDPTQGVPAHNIAIFTPAACPTGTTRHVTKIDKVTAARPADQAEADKWPEWGNLYSPTAASLPGPLVAFPAAMNWQSLAQLRGLRIVAGNYDLVTRCQDNLGQRVFAEWKGRVVFDSPTHYAIPAPYATRLGKEAMLAGSPTPVPPHTDVANPDRSQPTSTSAAPTGAGGSGGAGDPAPGEGQPGAGAGPQPSAGPEGSTPVQTWVPTITPGQALPTATPVAAAAPASSPGTDGALPWLAAVLGALAVAGAAALRRRRSESSR